MFTFTLFAFFVVLEFTSAQNGNCDFFQRIQVGVEYVVKSPNHPASYPPGVTCRWILSCPPGYNFRLDCNDMKMPATPSCSGDRLLVSETGDPQLYGATARCGNNPFVVVSTNQDISIGLIASTSSPGGAFRCTVKAQSAAPPTATCRCGERKQNRIVGGEETGVNEFISMAAIVTVATARIKCGATIIDKRWATTAAHCSTGETTNTIVLLVGDHNVTTGSDTSAARGYQIQSIIIHPQYDASTYNNDIALVRTVTIIEFSGLVGPACLPFKYYGYSFAGDYVTYLGWGTLFPGGPTSNVLRKVNVAVISQAQCRATFPQVTNNQICTYTPGKDACQFDSGGPGLYTEPNTGRLYLALIISFGRFCASTDPAINTRVTEMLNWLVYATGADFCKL